jgi:AbrB family looped-hinge helix DNA binding protein
MHLCNITANLHYVKTILRITSRGAVTLPAKLRKALGLKSDDQLIAETTPQGLLLRPSVTVPVEIYTPEHERAFDEAEAGLAALKITKRRRGTKASNAAR